MPSLLHHFLGFLVRQVGDLVLIGLEEGLHVLLALVALVLGHFLVFFGFFEVLVGIAANVAAGDLGVLPGFLDSRNHFLPLFAAHWLNRQAKHLSVDVGRHSQVAGTVSFLNFLV